MSEPFSLVVDEASDGLRIDLFLAKSAIDLSRARIRKLLESGAVTLNGVPPKISRKVRMGDTILLTLPEPEVIDIAPEEIPLDVVYEDNDLMVINKPAGLVVHPGAGNWSGTLVNALLFRERGRLSSIGGKLRPGIVHRLDKETSGLMVVAKNDRAHHSLSDQLQTKEMGRTYLALVKGEPQEREGTIATHIDRDSKQRKRMAVVESGGREAVTHYRTLHRYEKCSLLEVTLQTGRTHQIRVHMAHIRTPVIGDAVYSRGIGKYPIKRQALHAWKLSMRHPSSGNQMTFESPLPPDMAKLLQSVGGDPTPFMAPFENDKRR